MDSNERIDRGINELQRIIELEKSPHAASLNISRWDVIRILRAMKTPVETSGYSTETPTYDGVIEHNKKITSVFIKGEQFVLFNPEGKIWLERAKKYMLVEEIYKSTICINEAIELIYGKVEE